MRISIFGIGYVGAVTGACLARDGHDVVAVDINPTKVDILNAGCSPITEPGLDELIETGVRMKRLSATSNAEEAIAETDVSLVCVGTPSAPNGSLDTSYVKRTGEEIGRALARKSQFHSVVIRSTVLPGTTENIVIPAIELGSGKRRGEGFGVAFFPEFLREGSAIRDFDKPGTIVIGVLDETTRDRLLSLHERLDETPQILGMRAAEAIKYANNSWHALKVSFANEMGLICKAFRVDSHEVMDALCKDTKLNISPAYLKPGFAFGGSCLPKDVRALRHGARAADVDTPVLDAALMANENQMKKALSMIDEAGLRRVGLVGLSFKPNTDDLRSSPFVSLAERLIGRGFDLRIYDPIVYRSCHLGANRESIMRDIPHLAERMVKTGEDLLSHSEVVVVGNPNQAKPFMDKESRGGRVIIDLVRVERYQQTSGLYHGICW